MKELSVRKVADNKFELFRNIPNSLDVIDGAVYHCLQKLSYRVETRETAEIRNGIKEFLRDSMSRKWVLREEPSRGIVKYYWTEEVVGIIVGPIGGMMFRKKKDDLTECTLFNPIRLPKDSDESYQERRKLAFEKALELIQLLAENGDWPIDPISNWEIAQEFTFDADAITVCNRLLKGNEQRTIKMTDNL